MKKQTFAVVAFALIALFFLGGCASVSGQVIRGSGKVVQESPAVSGISSVQLEGIGDVVITQGETESLTVEAEDNILPMLDTHMDGSKLVIGIKRAYMAVSINPTRPIRYNLTVKNLNAIDLSGSGNFSSGSLKSGSLEVKISGSGNVDLSKVSADQVTAEISGSGSITLAGEAKNQQISIPGSGQFKGRDLKGSTATVRISGSGSATVNAAETVDAQISGSGNVAYLGSPKVSSNVSGSGSVTSAR
ncbi:MAG TPA: head GIN domain-containing protein [Anaerolineaceae bacterium]|nr:head GIN domain-containing protein [Anaerolineaceae bacterium]